MNTDRKLGQTKITPLIFMMSAPAIISMVVQALYNIVDSWFLSSYDPTLKPLSAVSLSFPIQMIIISLFVGLGIGVNSVIARRLGEQKRDEAINAAEHGFFFGIILWVFLALLTIKLPEIFFSQFTEDPQIIEYGVTYISIILLFSIGRIMAQVIISIFQASGDMITAMIIQLAGAVTNIILDYFLIFGHWIFPEMGIAGAAIATVSGQFVSLIIAAIIIYTKKHALKPNLKDFHLDKQITKNILAVSIPSALMQGLGSIMLAGLNKILSNFGDTAYTFLGIYYKIQSLIFMPVFGLTQGMMPVMGYNYGARNKKRVMQTLKVGVIIGVSIMAVGTVIFQLFPAQLLRAFNATDAMVEIGVPAIRIISSCFVLAAISIVVSTMFQALGDAYFSMVTSFARQIIVILPAAKILSSVYGLEQTWYAFPISEFVCVCLVVVFAVYEYKKKIKHLVPIDQN
ncbi:MAG: MATE family efflux transporter [Eubacteriales bacterium]